MPVRAKQTVHYEGPDGGTRTLGGGQEFDEGDQLVKDHPAWFETVSVDHEPADDKPKRASATRSRAKAKDENKDTGK